MITMRELIKRCTHCKATYTYRASGGDYPEFNDDRYCGSCNEIITNALKPVVVKFQPRFRDVREMSAYSEITLEMVLAWEKEWQDYYEKNPPQTISDFFSRGTRVYPGLVKMEGNKYIDSQKIRNVHAGMNTKWSGQPFRVSTWSKSPEHEIAVEMEWDLVNGCWTGRKW